MFFRTRTTAASHTETARKRATVANLFESQYERMVRFIAVRTGDLTEAEDLASEVFVRALRSVDSYKETGAPMEAWLYRIARNLIVDYLRRRGRRPAMTTIESAYDLSGDDDPTQNVENEEEAARVRRALAQLTDAQQEVLALRFSGQLTSEQVAAALGKKPGAVREMQSAALKRLRQVLEAEESQVREGSRRG